jgi:DnaK suppressor protein
VTGTNPEQARSKLLQLRAEIEVSVAEGKDSAAVVELDQSKVGRLSRMDAMQGQAMAQASAQRRQAMLQNVDAALQRIEDGSYGLCLDCDEPIADKRLEFDPTAPRCIGCQSKREIE